MTAENLYLIAAILGGVSLVAIVVWLFNRKRDYTEEELSWRKAIAIASVRIARFDFLDRKKISQMVAHKTNARLGKKLFDLTGKLTGRVTLDDIKDQTKFEALWKGMEAEVDKLGLSRGAMYKLALGLWDIGLAGYGLPVKELIEDERLLTPLLYRLAQGKTFHFDPKHADELNKLRGLYIIYSKNAGQKNITKSILFIVGYQTHEEIKTPEGDTHRDHRAVAFEISKDPRFQHPIIRGGTFIPFLPQSMAFLSLQSKVCDDLRKGAFADLIDPAATFLDNSMVTLDESFKYISLEHRPGEVLRGTFLNREIVGKFVGVSIGGPIDDNLVGYLGMVNESELENLHDLERIAIDELRSSFEASPGEESIGD